MDKEVIIAVVLAALVLVSLFQTFQLVSVSNKIATGALSAGTSTSTSGQNLGSGSTSGSSTGSSASSGGSAMVGGC